jgi:phage terminase small subunit
MAGPLKNARHERFAVAIATGMPASTAYVEAGFAYNEGNAIRLKGNEKVAARIEELVRQRAERVTEKTAIDAAWVLTKAAELHAKALDEKQLSVAKGALDLIGKHVDVQAFKEQIQHSGLIEYRDLSDEEIAARIAAHEADRVAGRPTTH